MGHDSDVYSAKPLERPDYDDYDDVDSYGLYWDAEAFKTHYDMTFAYRILKKLIGSMIKNLINYLIKKN
ncbi:hypothetical protein ONA00_05090 [Mycoplasmopsis cynos]|uniref:hypothetical protein n=1 Tax=Mycoplasmopsis cynos TaxID=171284 RepID=UPI0024CD15EC|nr:hypothetical protein [Mycoplasmopsis cynos]WAM10692.1 hypothetical protein ONA00_05090 [Mycoplasmopsis cynos]